MTNTMIAARGLTKRYGSQTAVDGLSLTVQAGEIFGLLGPNGAGKTTAIEMMEGLRRPDAGTCTIAGFDTARDHQAVRTLLGISLQKAEMPYDSTVVELLRLYASFYANPLPVGDLLRQFNLAEKAGARCQNLSGGQRQRLALALALVGRPRVIFLDEPTTGLDPQSRHSLWEVILGLRSEGRAIVMTTHYMEEAEKLCDRVAVMDHGRILAEGTPRQLTREYGPESAIEVELNGGAADPANLPDLSRLEAVTGVKAEEHMVILHTANTAVTLMALAGYARERNLPLGELRTRSAGMEDVFMALTGRRLRD